MKHNRIKLFLPFSQKCATSFVLHLMWFVIFTLYLFYLLILLVWLILLIYVPRFILFCSLYFVTCSSLIYCNMMSCVALFCYSIGKRINKNKLGIIPVTGWFSLIPHNGFYIFVHFIYTFWTNFSDKLAYNSSQGSHTSVFVVFFQDNWLRAHELCCSNHYLKY